MPIQIEPDFRANSRFRAPAYLETLSPTPSSAKRSGFSRRRFLQAGALGALGLAVYSGEIARHWIEITRRDAQIPGLPLDFDGLKVAQLSDIHLENFTEPFFLRDAVRRINQLDPDVIFLTGDFVTNALGNQFGAGRFAINAAWQCADILLGLRCRRIYAVLGNHDLDVGAKQVSTALRDNGITVLRNSYLPIERGKSRIWLAGLDDPVEGHPVPDLAIPASIRNIPGEPVILLCHAPDFARTLSTLPAGQAVSLMLSGHTHGGQIRLPLVGALVLPIGGRLYPEGLYHVGRMQLYVNRGLGTVGVPFRFDCPPEITLHTLRAV
ncbi:MAG TPA: metallophosphoesterase [Terracidiphilus sp.]